MALGIIHSTGRLFTVANDIDIHEDRIKSLASWADDKSRTIPQWEHPDARRPAELHYDFISNSCTMHMMIVWFDSS